MLARGPGAKALFGSPAAPAGGSVCGPEPIHLGRSSRPDNQTRPPSSHCVVWFALTAGCTYAVTALSHPGLPERVLPLRVLTGRIAATSVDQGTTSSARQTRSVSGRHSKTALLGKDLQTWLHSTSNPSVSRRVSQEDGSLYYFCYERRGIVQCT